MPKYIELSRAQYQLAKFASAQDNRSVAKGVMKAAKELERLAVNSDHTADAVQVKPEQKCWIEKIISERDRQDKKWGFPQENTYSEWSNVLGEEVGELDKEFVELNFGRGDTDRMVAEAVQVAAVALAILEQQDVARETTLRAAKALGRIPEVTQP